MLSYMIQIVYKLKILMIFILVLSITLTACTGSKKKLTKGNSINNLEKAKAVLQSLATGDINPITNYVNKDKYIQHNLTFADGRQTMLDALPALKKAGGKAEVKRAFTDGNYVFLHTDYLDFGEALAGFDIFRFENGLIVEHWDNLSPIAPANPSGHTQLDGEVKVTDVSKTQENKTIISNFVNDILMGKNMNNFSNYFDGDKYIQHNSAISDGVSGLTKALTEMEKAGITMKYDTLHMVLGEGNFVLTVSEGKFANQDTSFYDLFRVENGKIAEHWDVMETISKTPKHSNGKF